VVWGKKTYKLHGQNCTKGRGRKISCRGDKELDSRLEGVLGLRKKAIRKETEGRKRTRNQIAKEADKVRD